MVNKFPWGKAAAIVGIAAGLLIIGKEAGITGGFTTGGGDKGTVSGSSTGWDTPSAPSTPDSTITKKESISPPAFITQTNAGTYATPTPISEKILSAMSNTNPFTTPYSFTQTAMDINAKTQAQADTFFGGVVTSKKSIVSIPAWMGGNEYTTNINKLKTEGYSYAEMSPTGEFVFTKKISTAPVAAKETTVVTSAGSTVYDTATKKVVASSTNKSRTDSSGRATQTFTSRGWVGK